jgi:hypothetical protein
MARSTPPETFEWPPVEDPATNQIVEFRSGSAEPMPHPFESVKSPAPAAQRESDVARNLPKPPRPAEAAVPHRQVLQQPASTGTSASRGMSLSHHWSRLRSRVIPAALVTLTLTALVEAVYIVRALSPQPAASTANAEPKPMPPREEARVQRAAAPVAVPESTAVAVPVPSTTTIANVSPPTPRSTRGRVVVRSDPPGAQVFLDGRSYGVTPRTLNNVRPGERELVLKLDATELKQAVHVEGGGTISIVAPMQSTGPASGWIAIASPVEVDIFEGGALLGTSRSRQIMLPAGPHTLELVNENLRYRQTREVRVEAGKAEHIPVALPRSTINLNALPWAEVLIDGESVGQTPIGNLPIVIGTHEIVFRHPELGEQRASATIKAGIPTRLVADLRAQARK